MTGAPMTVADVYDAAADLIEPDGAWFQATRRLGRPQYCAASAMHEATGRDISPLYSTAYALLRERLGRSIVDWNDDPATTQELVVKTFRQAAAEARGENAS